MIESVMLPIAGIPLQATSSVLFDAFLMLLRDPNSVFVLFIIAMLGIYVEIAHPGVIFPGVIGALALILFLFAANALSPNWAGFVLMALSFVLLVLDVHTPTHGVLTLGAIISLILGSFLFFDANTSAGGPQLNPLLVYTTAVLVGLIGFMVAMVALRIRRLPVNTGTEGMVGAQVVTLTALSPEGRVRYGGEDWAAVLDVPGLSVEAGTEVQVVFVEGLRLHVQPMNMMIQHTEHSMFLREQQ